MKVTMMDVLIRPHLLKLGAEMYTTNRIRRVAEEVGIKPKPQPEKPKTVWELLEEQRIRNEQGDWYPASNGTETPFRTRTGRRLLYCYQPTTGRHAYLDLDTDLILSNEEAEKALALY